MRRHSLTSVALLLWTSFALADVCSKDVAPLLNKLFSSLGHDCNSYVSLYDEDAKYFHQHDGFKQSSELLATCQAYAKFCPRNECRFLQNGAALKVARGGSCHILAPYLWSEMPSNKKAKGNLEPHTGWEYIVASPNDESRFNYRIKYFAEIETSYSVAFNWANPENTPDVVAKSTLHLLSLKNSASQGECNIPLAPTLTQFFSEKSKAGDTWRQQGDAVVLAAGGVCHVAVPFAAQVGSKLKTGDFVFTLLPMKNTYQISDVVEFSKGSL